MRSSLIAVLLLFGGLISARGQTLTPAYSSNYVLTNLGALPGGVPTSYGGLIFKAGDTNTLLIGGNANQAGGAIYSVAVTRDANHHIISFGAVSQVATAPYIDGGLSYAPNGALFYTTYDFSDDSGTNSNNIGEILSGGSSPASLVHLTPLGVSPSVGSLTFIPSGFVGAGTLMVGSYDSGELYSVPYSVNLDGTYSIGAATLLNSLSAGIEGLAYVKGGNPGFVSDTLLICDYTNNRVTGYFLDGSGSLTGSSADFVTGLTGAEGAVIDPVTGDFLFSTFGGGNSIYRVSGFAVVPEPAEFAWLVGGASLGLVLFRTRKK